MDKRRLRQEAANDFMQSLEHLNELLDGNTASKVFEDVSPSATRVLEQEGGAGGGVRQDEPPPTNSEPRKSISAPSDAPSDVNVSPS